MKIFLVSLLLLQAMAAAAQKEFYLLVGTYTNSGSEGIYVYKFNSTTGEATAVSNARSSNPSFLAVAPDEKFVYAVNEDKEGMVSAFAFDKKTGTLSAINQTSSGGSHPCYITIDKNGKWVLTGNYSSGTLSLHAVKKDGGLDSATQVIEHSGYSVNTDRQEGPHVHATVLSPDNKFLFVPDLGIDRVHIYSFDTKKGQLEPTPVPFQITEPGAGPRHLDFHPNGAYAYLIEELTGSISVYRYNKGELLLQQNISALPGDYDGPVGSADIHVSPDGKFLYASNRGESNTIAIFSINREGRLAPVGHVSTLGKTPRNFNFDPTGKYLLVANQNSDEIVIFSRDQKSGMLTDTGKRIAVSKPVCIKWIKP